MGDSLHYGTRFSRALKDSYKRIGAATNSGVLPDKKRSQRSHQLHEALRNKEGLFSFLNDLRGAHADDCAKNEHFGVFLWLRDISNIGSSSYALRLMVASTYVHWDQWSAYRLEPVVESTGSAAAASVFYGRLCIVPIHSGSSGNPWRSALGVPIVADTLGPEVKVGDGPRAALLGEMVIGAVSINSDKSMPTSGLAPSELTVFSCLSAQEISRLASKLTECVQCLFR